MAVTRKTYKTAEEILAARIDALEAQVKSLQNAKVPTVPIYDETNFPAQAVYGQLAMGGDNNIYNYGVDDVWHVPAGAGTITEIDSGDGSISVVNPTGAVVDLSVNFPPTLATIHDYETTTSFGTSGWNGTPVNNQTWTLLDWTRDATNSNAVLLDHTVSTIPTIIADGVYAFSLTAMDYTLASRTYWVEAHLVIEPAVSAIIVARASTVSLYDMVPPNTYYNDFPGAMPLSFTRFLAAGTKLWVYANQYSGINGKFYLTGTTTKLST